MRVCMDPRSLNLAIIRTHFVIPDIELIKAKINGATKFSTLNAKNGF